MENKDPRQAREELDQALGCSVCQKGTHSSGSTSAQCNCQRSTADSSAISSQPDPVTAVQPQPSNQPTEDNNQPIVSTSSDDKYKHDYRTTYCKIPTCLKPMEVRHLLQHLRSEHTLIIFTNDSAAMEFGIYDNAHYQVIPLYVFGTIIWETILFTGDELRIYLYHESPDDLTPSLKAVVSLQFKTFGLHQPIRVMSDISEPEREEVILPLLGSVLLSNSESGGPGSSNSVIVKHSIKIIKED